MTRDQVESFLGTGSDVTLACILPSTEPIAQAQCRKMLGLFAFNDTPPGTAEILGGERERGFGFGLGVR